MDNQVPNHILLRMYHHWPAQFNRIKLHIEQHCHNLAVRKYGHVNQGARGPQTLMARFPLLTRYMPKPNYWIIYPCLRYVFTFRFKI